MIDPSAILEPFCRLLAKYVVDEQVRRSEDTYGWQSQDGSPLGRKHNSVVRARIERDEQGASIVGRKHLLSPAALTDELQAMGKRPQTRGNSRAAVDSLRDELSRMEG